MWSNLKACAVCIGTERKLFDMDDWEQREDFNSVALLKSYGGDGLLSYLCVECSAYVKRFKKFQTKCQRANNLLQEMLNKKGQLNQLDISLLNREKLNLLPSLAYWKTDACHYEEIEFKWVTSNKININKYSNVPIFSVSITDYDVTPKSELYTGEHLDNDEEKIKIDTVDNGQSVPNFVEIKVTEINKKTQNKNEVSSSDEDGFQDDVVNCDRDTVEAAPTEQAAGAGGSTLDQQYANFYPLSDNQQKVVAEITKLFSNGPYKCRICNKGYHVMEQLEIHTTRYHQKYQNDLLFCKLCSYYFKTEHLFKSHMSNIHLYKYVCTKCPEVSYDRVSAKEHYIRSHLRKGHMRQATWHDVKRGWIRPGKRTKKASKNKGTKERNKDSSISDKPKMKISKSTFVRTPLGHLEQYELINERQKSRNYIDSMFKCELCFRGFREIATFNNHLKKHDPKYSGPLMCDVCKLYFKNTGKMYIHISTVHQFRYICQKCQFVSYSSSKALSHNRWHENFTYSCSHCGMVFSKRSTQLSHIRIKHPSTNICNICGHSFIGIVGLGCHMRIIHSKEEMELSEKLSQQVSEEGDLYCRDCKMHFASNEAFRIHLGSSNKHTTINLSVAEKKLPPMQQKVGGRTKRRPNKVARTKNFTPTDCEKCGQHLTSNEQARQHYHTEHPGAELLYLCHICGYNTKVYLSLTAHMRTHTKEKPYACQICDKRFSICGNRDRHLMVHTGEKRHECSHCHRRFGLRSTLKLHIQTVHLKIPYPPWNKKNRKRRTKPELCDSPSKSKQLVEKQGEYLDAYISYQDEA